jgi:hypothetical protein
MGAGVELFVPAHIVTLCPLTVMLPVTMLGHVPLTAGILGPEPVVMTPLLLPPACASAEPPELPDDEVVDPELLPPPDALPDDDPLPPVDPELLAV